MELNAVINLSAAPRVESCINAVLARHSVETKRGAQEFFEAVHQELAPLARELERELLAKTSRTQATVVNLANARPTAENPTTEANAHKEPDMPEDIGKVASRARTILRRNPGFVDCQVESVIARLIVYHFVDQIATDEFLAAAMAEKKQAQKHATLANAVLITHK